ncbi:MAG: PilN domain-containing protein [Gammaproteobacteria bacterium]|nr:PilN domain-containing protein [Gammaproteobacteria bacterium]
MARINLLPWREDLRKQRQREFGVMIAGALLVTLLLAFYAHLHISGMIDYQKARNDFLKKEIAEMDRKIKEIKDLESTKAKLLARINVIQQLQSSRPEVVHLFDELVTRTPEGSYLTDVSQKVKSVTINGRAQSNARVSSYMRNFELSKWLHAPSLQVVENKDKTGTGFSHFTMSVSQINKRAASKATVKRAASKATVRGGAK